MRRTSGSFGGRVPIDGRIIDGAAELDESMITGDSRPVPRGIGDWVVASTVATDSAYRLALEQMRTVDAVLFDKTGTLTRGAHTVTATAAVGDVAEDEVLRIAGAVEADSEHPLARALVTVARERGLRTVARDFRSLTGRGVQAVGAAGGAQVTGYAAARAG